MENMILFDWLSFTSKVHSPQNIIDMLGLASVSWQTLKGAQGYQERLYYDKISIHFNGREDMGVWCEMSGQGCRAFETHGHGDYYYLFNEILSHGKEMNITRLDIAYDDHKGILDINTLCLDTYNQNFVSRFNDWEVIYSSKGNSILHGSKSSEIIVRIYDKAKERKMDDDVHWIRVELQLRRDRALSFINQFVMDQVGDEVNFDLIGKAFSGVLNNYLRYVEPNFSDCNKKRWELRDYWEQLLTSSCVVKLFQKPGTDYNLEHLERFVFKQAGNAIATYLEIMGEDDFREKLKNRGTAPNAKYTALKEKCYRDPIIR